MSNFICEKCGTACYGSPVGYITGCEHYPPDVQPLGNDFEKILYDNLENLYEINAKDRNDKNNN